VRALVLTNPGPLAQDSLEPRDVPTPRPGPGQVLVAVAANGICRTDLHVIEGELPSPKLPLIPGHQIVGTVSALGAGVEGVSPEDRVGVAC
jgi:propanol-preferring alcohol dehydrogenase